MIRSLRAFMWLRWRLLVNAIRGSERRDTLERVSRTLAVMAPIIVLVMSTGSLVAAGILGFVGGRAAATGLVEPATIIFIVRVVLGVLLVLIVFMTILAPVQTMMSSYNRLLLLPIPRASLHLVEVMANLTDPWITVIVPGLITFAIGLAVGGRAGMALVAAAAGLAIVFVLISIAALVSFLLGWLLRSRRRGELFTLVFVLGLSMVSIVPALVSSNFDSHRKARGSGGRPPREPFSVTRFDASLPRWSLAVPSELYGAAVGAAAARNGRARLARRAAARTRRRRDLRRVVGGARASDRVARKRARAAPARREAARRLAVAVRRRLVVGRGAGIAADGIALGPRPVVDPPARAAVAGAVGAVPPDARGARAHRGRAQSRRARVCRRIGARAPCAAAIHDELVRHGPRGPDAAVSAAAQRPHARPRQGARVRTVAGHGDVALSRRLGHRRAIRITVDLDQRADRHGVDLHAARAGRGLGLGPLSRAGRSRARPAAAATRIPSPCLPAR